jgi:hypothetical protein
MEQWSKMDKPVCTFSINPEATRKLQITDAQETYFFGPLVLPERLN